MYIGRAAGGGIRKSSGRVNPSSSWGRRKKKGNGDGKAQRGSMVFGLCWAGPSSVILTGWLLAAWRAGPSSDDLTE